MQLPRVKIHDSSNGKDIPEDEEVFVIGILNDTNNTNPKQVITVRCIRGISREERKLMKIGKLADYYVTINQSIMQYKEQKLNLFPDELVLRSRVMMHGDQSELNNLPFCWKTASGKIYNSQQIVKWFYMPHRI